VLVAGTCVFAHPGGPAAGVQALREALRHGPTASL
jgi:ribulose 1,5-bisphosphate carboxylase large subunit-like protein